MKKNWTKTHNKSFYQTEWWGIYRDDSKGKAVINNINHTIVSFYDGAYWLVVDSSTTVFVFGESIAKITE